MGKVSSDSQTVAHTMETIYRAYLQALASTLGPTASSMRVNGSRASNKAQACGWVPRATPTSGSGPREPLMAMGSTPGSMGIDMRGSSSTGSSMAKESNASTMEIFIKDSIIRGNLRAMGSTTGPMAAISRAISRLVSGRDRVSGKKIQEMEINMKVCTTMTRNMVSVLLLGPLETITKAIIKMNSGTAMEKCTGLTKAIIRANGRMELSMVKDKYISLGKG